MEINTLADIEYKYIFNINDITEARKLCKQRCETIKRSNYTTEKEKIEELSCDLDSLFCKIIERKGINKLEDYNYAVDAAIVANSDIQILIERDILRNQFGKVKKSHPLYKEFQQWRNIYIKIGAKSWAQIMVENHSTDIFFIMEFIGFSLLIIIGALSHSGLLVVLGASCFLLFSIATLEFDKRLERRSYIDHMNSIKNSIQYKSGAVLKSTNREVLNLFSSVWKKI